MIKKSLIVITSFLCLLGHVVIALGFIITLNIEKTDVILAEGKTRFDDWYTVSRIDGQTVELHRNSNQKQQPFASENDPAASG